jgi:hypothetical protein
VVLVAGVESRAAVPPAENLLPNTTKGFLTAASMDVLRDSWNKTQIGQLMQDEAMKPFVEDFQRQMQDKWLKTHQKLGITWDDLQEVPSGEVALGLILPSATEAAAVIVANVAGHEKQTAALLEKINRNLTSQKATRHTRKVGSVVLTVFDVPKTEDEAARQVAYFVNADLLAAADNLKVLEGILARQQGNKADSLATLNAFSAITKRCQKGAGDLAPHARWFVEPFGYADAIRVANDHPRKKGTDMLKILKEQGFTAIQGIGGFVNFNVEPYEMLHRTFVFAPGNGNGERFTLAARMLDFPNGGEFVPPNWVPRDVATFAAFNVNTKNAFESSKTLVNAVVGDEVFEDVLDSIRTDENGPQIDIRRDVIALLGNRLSVISDLQLPVTPKSERMLVAVDTTDQAHLAAVIKKWMESDPDTRRRLINGHEVFEVVDEKADLPMVTIENSPAIGNSLVKPEEQEEEKEEKALMPNSAVTVAHGHLFVATHIDILAKVLAPVEERELLSNSADYRRVQVELTKLAGAAEQFAQVFTRTDDAYRGTYELVRAGKMPEAESILGKMLNNLLGESKEGVLRPQRIDGSKLPDFDVARRYLGPAGVTGTAEADGWFAVGFTLSKDSQ